MKDLKVLSSFYGKLALCFLLGFFNMSCEKEEMNTSNLEVANASVKALNTVKITSTGMNFLAPDEIPSGWNTFSYQNKGHVPHFYLLVKVPEGKTLEEYRNEITVPFNEW